MRRQGGDKASAGSGFVQVEVGLTGFGFIPLAVPAGQLRRIDEVDARQILGLTGHAEKAALAFAEVRGAGFFGQVIKATVREQGPRSVGRGGEEVAGVLDFERAPALFAHIQLPAGFPEDPGAALGDPVGVGAGGGEARAFGDFVVGQHVDQRQLPAARFVEVEFDLVEFGRFGGVGGREGERVVGGEVLRGEVAGVAGVCELQGAAPR